MPFDDDRPVRKLGVPPVLYAVVFEVSFGILETFPCVREAQEAREDAALFVEDAPQLPHASLRRELRSRRDSSPRRSEARSRRGASERTGQFGYCSASSLLMRVRFCGTVRSHGDARVVRGDAVGVLLYRRGLVFRLPARKDPAARGRPDDVPAFRGAFDRQRPREANVATRRGEEEHSGEFGEGVERADGRMSGGLRRPHDGRTNARSRRSTCASVLLLFGVEVVVVRRNIIERPFGRSRGSRCTLTSRRTSGYRAWSSRAGARVPVLPPWCGGSDRWRKLGRGWAMPCAHVSVVEGARGEAKKTFFDVSRRKSGEAGAAYVPRRRAKNANWRAIHPSVFWLEVLPDRFLPSSSGLDVTSRRASIERRGRRFRARARACVLRVPRPRPPPVASGPPSRRPQTTSR